MLTPKEIEESLINSQSSWWESFNEGRQQELAETAYQLLKWLDNAVDLGETCPECEYNLDKSCPGNDDFDVQNLCPNWVTFKAARDYLGKRHID
jgi:hypothetical protein